jgi:hypothetical protein
VPSAPVGAAAKERGQGGAAVSRPQRVRDLPKVTVERTAKRLPGRFVHLGAGRQLVTAHPQAARLEQGRDTEPFGQAGGEAAQVVAAERPPGQSAGLAGQLARGRGRVRVAGHDVPEGPRTGR